MSGPSFRLAFVFSINSLILSGGRNFNGTKKHLVFTTKAKCRTRNMTLTEMQGLKLQKKCISYKTVYTNVDMKNLLCISSGKELKS